MKKRIIIDVDVHESTTSDFIENDLYQRLKEWIKDGFQKGDKATIKIENIMGENGT